MSCYMFGYQLNLLHISKDIYNDENLVVGSIDEVLVYRS